MAGFDYVLVGGGLQNGLIALALRARRPDASIALIERDHGLGGNHTWCFHARDVPPSARAWLEPLVVRRWSGYKVLFPRGTHDVASEYGCISSERFDAVVSAAVRNHRQSSLMTGVEVTQVEAERVLLDDGREVRGHVVVDARGPGPHGVGGAAGYQKFVGLELELREAHQLDRPILMDATVEQSSGYRFMYVLPFEERVVLVEDTYFHESPELDREKIRHEICAYIARQGWEVSGIRREESGVLPMPWAGRFEPPRGGPLVAGYRGGWFHPGTGYSLPVALRLAELVASHPPETLFGGALARAAREHRAQARFAFLLNDLLFRWYPPRARISIFERFYRLPEDTIGNWYALRLRWRDRFRMLAGWPPGWPSLRHRLGFVAR